MKLQLQVALVIIVVGTLAYPWAAPTHDTQLKGFDQGYLYVNPYGQMPMQGSVEVSPDELTISATTASQPTVFLASSQSAYTLDFDVTVKQDTPRPAFPFEIIVFYPGTNNRISLWYNSPDKWIRSDIERSNYTDRVHPEHIARYLPGSTMHFRVRVVPYETVEFMLSNSTWSSRYSRNATVLGPLLSSSSRTVSILASIDNSTEEISTSVTISNFILTVPGNTFGGPKVAYLPAAPVFLTVALASAVFLVLLARESATKFVPVVRNYVSRIPKTLWILALGAMLLQIPLWGIANHPYDMFAEKLYTYSLMQEGLGVLYTRPSVTTAASPWGGVPFDSAEFVYPPLYGYYFLTVGFFLTTMGVTNPSAFEFEVGIKLFGAILLILGGFVTYFLVRRLGGSERYALIASALYLFNPVLVYDTAVWGQADSLVTFMIVSAAWFLLSSRHVLFWTMALASVFTKQTALIPSVVMMALSLRAWSWRESFRGLSISLGVIFLAFLPYVLAGYSPLVAVNPMFSVFHGEIAGVGATDRAGMISADAYSLIPLISPLSGVSGRDRMYLTASSNIPGTSLSYSTFGASLFVIVTATVSAGFLMRKRKATSTNHLLLVGCITLLSTLMFTGVSPRYFALAIALLIPPTVVLRSRILSLALSVISVTSVLSMHGLLVLWEQWYPGIFGDVRFGSFNRWLLSLYLSDQTMTLAILANLAVAIAVIWKVLNNASKGEEVLSTGFLHQKITLKA